MWNSLITKNLFKDLCNIFCLLFTALWIFCYLCFLGSFAEEDLGRQGLSVTSVMGNATASRGLEVAVANLQDYCNGTGSAYCCFIDITATGKYIYGAWNNTMI